MIISFLLVKCQCVWYISSITGQCLVCIWLYPIQWLQGQIVFNTRYALLLLLICIFAREIYEIIISIDRFTCSTDTDYTCFSLGMSKCVSFSIWMILLFLFFVLYIHFSYFLCLVLSIMIDRRKMKDDRFHDVIM